MSPSVIVLRSGTAWSSGRIVVCIVVRLPTRVLFARMVPGPILVRSPISVFFSEVDAADEADAVLHLVLCANH